MSKVEFELDRAGVRELLQSPEMRKMITETASKVKSRAGEGYASSERTTDRVSSTVYADTIDAMVDNSKSNTLLKALKG